MDERLVGCAKLLALFAVQFVVPQCLFYLTVNTPGMSHIKKRYRMLQAVYLTPVCVPIGKVCDINSSNRPLECVCVCVFMCTCVYARMRSTFVVFVRMA